MKFVSSIYSDIGTTKEVNQDGAVVLKAHSDKGDVLCCIVCDGMGGLSQGEIACATALNSMEKWFKTQFPKLLYSDFSFTNLKKSLKDEINKISRFLDDYGKKQHISLGTTLVMLLIVQDTYYICNVGDSRVYSIRNKTILLTHDQSYIQNEIDMGRMTPEEAKNSPQRSVLLQSIGSTPKVEPDFHVGECQSNTNFLLCSDGFRHVISEDDIQERLNPIIVQNKETMEKSLKELTELIKEREEEDNITSVLIHVV